MQRLTGIGVSPGIVAGRAVVLRRSDDRPTGLDCSTVTGIFFEGIARVIGPELGIQFRDEPNTQRGGGGRSSNATPTREACTHVVAHATGLRTESPDETAGARNRLGSTTGCC